jgi:hypothetical protein
MRNAQRAPYGAGMRELAGTLINAQARACLAAHGAQPTGTAVTSQP